MEQDNECNSGGGIAKLFAVSLPINADIITGELGYNIIKSKLVELPKGDSEIKITFKPTFTFKT